MGAWDHFRRDFCVVYRPLYHCEAKTDRFEDHVLATSHFDRFDSKFRKISYYDLDMGAKAMALPGPFWRDDSWGLPHHTVPIQGTAEVLAAQDEFYTKAASLRTSATSGHGTRSHRGSTSE